MTDGFASAIFFSVVALCVTFLMWDARRRKAAKPDDRLDRVVANLQREAQERGKLSKRLAQAETKIARLQRSPALPSDHRGTTT